MIKDNATKNEPAKSGKKPIEKSPLELNLGLFQEDFCFDGHFLQKQVTFCKGY